VYRLAGQYPALFEGFVEGEFLGVVVKVEVRVFGGEGGDWGGWVDLFREALKANQVDGYWDGFGLHLLNLLIVKFNLN
jgi:hypothetical protein